MVCTGRDAMLGDDTLLSQFPKKRPALPAAYRAIYAEHYKRNREGASAASSLSRKMEQWMHRKVAEDVARNAREWRTLEIGAGNLNHVPYEPRSERYDVVEEFSHLAAGSPNRPRVTNVYRDLNEIRDQHYDRIISIAAFEHYCSLPEIVGRCGLLLAGGGQLRVAIPSEGTLLWILGWKLTTGLEFRLKYGLDYGVLMRHEHVNTAAEIEGVLRIFFKAVRRSVFGFSRTISFYQFFECTSPNITRCEEAAERRKNEAPGVSPGVSPGFRVWRNEPRSGGRIFRRYAAGAATLENGQTPATG